MDHLGRGGANDDAESAAGPMGSNGHEGRLDVFDGPQESLPGAASPDLCARLGVWDLLLGLDERLGRDLAWTVIEVRRNSGCNSTDQSGREVVGGYERDRPLGQCCRVSGLQQPEESMPTTTRLNAV